MSGVCIIIAGTVLLGCGGSVSEKALRLAENLLREHGCDLEIALHLDPISQPPSIWFNKKRMRDWCLAGFPPIQI